MVIVLRMLSVGEFSTGVQSATGVQTNQIKSTGSMTMTVQTCLISSFPSFFATSFWAVLVATRQSASPIHRPTTRAPASSTPGLCQCRSICRHAVHRQLASLTCPCACCVLCHSRHREARRSKHLEVRTMRKEEFTKT